MKTISVVIPIYYGEGLVGSLAKAVAQVETDLAALDMQLQLIFVDDGSGDGTFAELVKYKTTRPLTSIVKLTRNFGAIKASKAGLKHVTGDCFTIMAADLQDPPELIVEMAKRWRAGAKYIYCERIKRHDPWLTRAYAAVFYFLVRAFVVKDFPKRGFDIMFWDAQILPHIRDCAKNVNRAMLAHWLGFKAEVISYDRPRREVGRSRWTFAKKVNLFVDTFVGFSILPIRAISLFGVVVAISSFGYGLVILIGALTGTAVVAGFPTLVVLLTFLMGTVMIMLGIIGEYMWRVFDSVSGGPEVVVEGVF